MKILDFEKKAIGPLVAVAFLLVISVTSVVVIKNWSSSLQSGIFEEVVAVDVNSIDILSLGENNLFLKNLNSQDLIFSDIRIDSKPCLVNGTILPNQIINISLNNCTADLSIGFKEISIITDVGVYSEVLMLNSVVFIPLGPFSGGFDGYAWGEQFGFISFNGSGYQVTMNNNDLSGFAYSEKLGFISFNGSNYGVTHINGILSGYAYGENIGYINFNNSPIYQTTFDGVNVGGFAYSENFGYIHFNYSPLYSVINN